MRNRTGTGKRGIGRALYAALLLIVAITLMVMGGYLMSLGGSAYFLLAGLAVLAAAILALRGDHRAPPVYALMLLGTLGWSLWEAGADPWALVSRLAAPIVLGLPMLWMWLGKGRRRTIGFGSLAFAVALLLGISLASPVAPPEAFIASTAPEGSGDWPYVGRDIGGTRYAPLTQINTANVNRLRAAWTYSAGSQISEATPLKIGDSLYFCTFDNQVIALDAETGAQRWRFDPKLAANRPAKFCRGVAYHQTGDAAPGTPCTARVFTSTRDARLIALDAASGKPCADFGEGGTVDLRANMGKHLAAYQYSSSPPLVVGDRVGLIEAMCADWLTSI